MQESMNLSADLKVVVFFFTHLIHLSRGVLHQSLILDWF